MGRPTRQLLGAIAIAARQAGLAAAVATIIFVVAMAAVGAAENVGVERLAGPTRYDTAAKLAAKTADARSAAEQGVAILARGDAFPDGLAAANLGDLPLFLTERDRLVRPAREGLRALGIQNVFVVGGTSAISETVVEELRRDGIQVERIAGDDRYRTARATYNRFYSAEGEVPAEVDGRSTVLIASGEAFPDALAGAPLAAAARLPILLTRRETLPSATKSAFDKSNGCPNGICLEQALLLGGAAAIAPTVEAELRTMGISVKRLVI